MGDSQELICNMRHKPLAKAIEKLESRVMWMLMTCIATLAVGVVNLIR